MPRRFTFLSYGGAATGAVFLPIHGALLWAYFHQAQNLSGLYKLLLASLPASALFTIIFGLAPILVAGFAFKYIAMTYGRISIFAPVLVAPVCVAVFNLWGDFLAGVLPDLDATTDPGATGTAIFYLIFTTSFLLFFLVTWSLTEARLRIKKASA